MKKFIRLVVIGIFLPALFLIFLVVIGVKGWVLEIGTGVVLLFTLLVFMSYFYNLRSPNYKYKRTYIYDWMNEPENDYEHLLSSLKLYPSYYSTISNLKAIKNTVMKQANEDIESLKLYKAFYNQIIKETTEELYFKTALIILSSLTVFVLRDYISGIGTGNKIIGFLIFFAFLINVAFISQKIVGNKKRIGLLIEILDICIEEAEEKKPRNTRGEEINY